MSRPGLQGQINSQHYVQLSQNSQEIQYQILGLHPHQHQPLRLNQQPPLHLHSQPLHLHSQPLHLHSQPLHLHSQPLQPHQPQPLQAHQHQPLPLHQQQPLHLNSQQLQPHQHQPLQPHQHQRLQPHQHQRLQPHQQKTLLPHQHQKSEPHQHKQHQLPKPNSQPLSPERILDALPDSYMHANSSSTPQCICSVQQHHQHSTYSSCSSSLLSFTDSSASFSSAQSLAATTPQAARRAADDRRRQRQMKCEEGRLRQLVADLDSRMRLAQNKELLSLQRMSAENVLRTVQAYVTAENKEASAATPTEPRQPSTSSASFAIRCEDFCEDSHNCSLLDC